MEHTERTANNRVLVFSCVAIIGLAAVWSFAQPRGGGTTDPVDTLFKLLEEERRRSAPWESFMIGLDTYLPDSIEFSSHGILHAVCFGEMNSGGQVSLFASDGSPMGVWVFGATSTNWPGVLQPIVLDIAYTPGMVLSANNGAHKITVLHRPN